MPQGHKSSRLDSAAITPHVKSFTHIYLDDIIQKVTTSPDIQS